MNKICDGNVKSFKSKISTTLTPYHNTAILQVKTIQSFRKKIINKEGNNR